MSIIVHDVASASPKEDRVLPVGTNLDGPAIVTALTFSGVSVLRPESDTADDRGDDQHHEHADDNHDRAGARLGSFMMGMTAQDRRNRHPDRCPERASRRLRRSGRTAARVPCSELRKA